MSVAVTDINELTFEPPGPGSWRIAAGPMPRPWPRFQTEIHPEQLTEGFRATGRRYGLLLDAIEYRFLHGFAYQSVRMVDKSEIAERCRTAEQAFADKLWRQDMDRWESEVKPGAIQANLELQAVDPATLSKQELLDHIERSREHYKLMVFEQHFHNGPALIPLGDFLAHTLKWTGRPLGELVDALSGAAPVSAGASSERSRVVAAIKADASARELLASDGEPGGVLEALCSQPGEVGDAARGYLDAFGYRLLDGVEVSNPYALEKPELLVKTLRAGAGGEERPHEETNASIERVRQLVPESERGRFDSLLGEARYTFRLRDERGVYTVAWAGGILRRALLEAGRRLAQEGRVHQPEQVIEAGWEELGALLGGEEGPSADDLAQRAAFRARYAATDAPPHLGAPPGPPPPPGELPPAGARAMRAMNTVLSALNTESDAKSEARVVRGLGASLGVYTGIARLIVGPEEFDRVQQGDVVVTRTTSEAFNIVLPLLGGVVTDSGGLLSHAAIVAREYGIPGVVGSRDATKVIPDGARVRIDGGAGEVTVLE
jgi:phosphohistidine swiveling domain-containing protein